MRKMPGSRYRSENFKTFYAGQGLSFICASGDSTSRTLPLPIAGLLRNCNSFRTLEGHAKEYYSHLKVRQKLLLLKSLLQWYPEFQSKRTFSDKFTESLLVRALSTLAAEGFLVSDAAVVGWAKRHSRLIKPPAPIATVAIVTANRVESLNRGLASYIENSRRCGRRTDFVVMDDSKSKATGQRYREVLRELKSRHGAAISYAGFNEKKIFAKALIRRGLPKEVVEFALLDVLRCGPTFGANLNAVLLHTAGEMVFCADDDTVCRIANPRQAKQGLEFSKEGNMQSWSFPGREAVLGAADYAEADILALHERLLGRSLGSCILEFGGPGESDLEIEDPEFLSALREGRGRVLATMSSLFGDCALGSPGIYLSAGGEGRRRLMRSEADYLQVLNREVIRAVSRPTIKSGKAFMTYATGLDNRQWLPPFPPSLRGQDGVFGSVLRACFNRGYIGVLPWMVLHAPLEARSFAREDFSRCSARFDISAGIGICVDSVRFGSSKLEPIQRCQALGRHLTELGSLEATEFKRMLQNNVWESANRLAMQYEALLRINRGKPEFWAKDVNACLSAIQAALVDPDVASPIDPAGNYSAKARFGLLQKCVRMYGRLLQAWPEIIQTAKELKAQGCRLAESV